MKNSLFRIPLGVDCFSKNGKVYVLGAYGKVVLKSNSFLGRIGHLVFFSPDINSYESSLFVQAILGVTLGYTIVLEMKGIGYRGREEGGKLIFFLGYSHPIIINKPEDVVVSFEKKKIFLKSANFGLLQNLATTIRGYRFPDSYKRGGVLYREEAVVRKEGKKT